ncbi:MAG: DUF3179 domain-containing protein [Anaerolineae bacterium]|nr:DUF3179 domain-containing protein [Anaerolineae bacterium]
MFRLGWVTVVLIGIGAVQAPHVHALAQDCPPPARVGYLDFWDTTDFCKHTVPLEEIISGGPPPDGIPPIDQPQFERIESAANWLQPQSPVVAFAQNADARAYPLGILTRHEIVNDEVAGIPVAVTFCPLCNAAMVFDRRVGDAVYRFGVSGNLRHSDLIMWDDVTKSWWQQFTGEGIVGVHAGDQLESYPALVVSFSEFAKQYPDGQVLSPERAGQGTNPYVGYDSDPEPFLFVGSLDTRLFATQRVLGILLGGEAVAYPFPVPLGADGAPLHDYPYPTLADERVINDTVGGFEVVAFWQPGAASALDGRVIDDSRDVGMAALYDRMLDGRTLTFSLDASGQITDDQTRSTWNIFGTAVAGELQGSQLQQRLAFPHFWFAWAAFRPDTRIWGQ